jgi:hypothetical protein
MYERERLMLVVTGIAAACVACIVILMAVVG